MQTKICLNCKKTFYRKDCKLEGAWVQKKFCSTNCRVDYNNIAKYELKDTQHDRRVAEVNKEIHGKIIFVQNTDKENPDIETESTCYEVELYGNIRKWTRKYARHRSGKKHVLILVPDERLKQFFDEIRFRA